jgi:uncharacterized glyoxalase superfamily protein PhnB
MTADVRKIEEPSALTAALDGAVARLTQLRRRFQSAVRERLSAPQTPPPADFARTAVIPTVRYRDVPKAVEWLCRAFGMRVHRVVADAGGMPCYAELTVGNGMLMVAPIEDTPFGKLMVQPDEIGGVETQVCYLCIDNARAHYKRAKAAGAVIVLDPDDDANRGRGYSCRDPEGHLWNFGTYNPWAGRSPAPAVVRWRPGRLQQGVAAAVLLVLAGVLLPQLVPQPSATAVIAALPAPAAAAVEEPPAEVAAPPAADTAGRETHAHSLAVEAAERTAAQARAELAEIRGALEKAERDAVATRAQVDGLQRARQAAERAVAEVRADLAAARQNADRARAEAVQERERRVAADRAMTTARRRAPVRPARQRARWSRTWCFDPSLPNQVANSAARLSGFCKA